MNSSTKKYQLRRLDYNDAESIFRIFSDWDILKYTDSNLHKSLSDSKNLINWYISGEKNQTHLYRGIVDSKTKEIIGIVGLYHIDMKHHFASISCILHKNYWRQGIMFNVLKELISFAFDDILLNRLEAQVFEYHVASVGLFSKLKFWKEALLRNNFMIEGKFENSYLFTMLRTEYELNRDFYKI